MSEKTMIYRCPVCFARENDVVLHHKGEHYFCVKCGFTGTVADIQDMYEDMKKKYHYITRRITLEDLEKGFPYEGKEITK